MHELSSRLGKIESQTHVNDWIDMTEYDEITQSAIAQLPDASFTWIPFYEELANKLLNHRKDRTSLIPKLRNAEKAVGLSEYKYDDISPFNVFGCFNLGTNTDKNKRIEIAKTVGKYLNVSAEPLKDVDGIPVVSYNKFHAPDNKDPSWQEDAYDRFWDVFEAALLYADNPKDGRAYQQFITCYDQARELALKVKGNRSTPYLTFGLYWFRPNVFIALDSNNRAFIRDKLPSSLAQSIDSYKGLPYGEEYLQICNAIRRELESGAYEFRSFPELSLAAVSREDNEEEKITDEVVGQEIDGMPWKPTVEEYDPGISAEKWLEILESPNPPSPHILTVLKRMLDNGSPCTYAELSNKYGMSIYFYINNISTAGEYILNNGLCEPIPDNGEFDQTKCWPVLVQGRDVSDTSRAGTFEYKLRPELKEALEQMDLSPYPLYETDGDADVSTDETSLDGVSDSVDEEQPPASQQPAWPPYTKADFLSEVYMEPERYDELELLVRRKKNVILEGAPGTGKTFAAKRLAWALMGEKAEDRVETIQFHQSYSYEDFVEGFRPVEGGGFELRHGSFYTFCKRAAADPTNEYFLIIDEINRGNLSKIFGELFMLIEADKRGTEEARLLYSGEPFSVPGNLYLIGTMNTADRSLAMLDYALRRRFAFFDLRPGFETARFKDYAAKDVRSPAFDELVACIERLNEDIEKDAALGPGFVIGHSFLCGRTAESATPDKLRLVVDYELVPLLREYWYDDPDTVEHWAGELRSACK